LRLRALRARGSTPKGRSSGRCLSCDRHFPVMKGHEDGG
jgi:hypothetical protein